MRRRYRLAAGMVLATTSTGCVSARSLGQLRVLKASDLLTAPGILEAIHKAQAVGGTLAGVLTVVLAFVCALQVWRGQPQEALESYVKGVIGCAFVLATWSSPIGVDTLTRELGEYLGQLFAAGDTLTIWGRFFHFGEQVARSVGLLQETVGQDGGLTTGAGAADPQGWFAQAVAYWFTHYFGSYLLVIDTLAAYLMKIVLQSVGAWLLTLYTIVGPIMAPALVLPSTRRLFWGWWRAYASLALWPMMFALCERVMLALPDGMFRMVQTSGGAGGLAEAATSGMLSLFLVNLLFFFVYLSVPTVSYLLVSASGRAFRGVL